MKYKFDIPILSDEIVVPLISSINNKTKPLGSLGILEVIAFKIGKIQQTIHPQLINPTILIFAGDHGIAKSGKISPYPQEVTYQMVLNFLHGGAAINTFSRQHEISIRIIDAGVNFEFEKSSKLIDAKIAMGTADYRFGPAMSSQQYSEAFKKGIEIVDQIYATGCNIIGFGEMGIGNTSSAALVMSELCAIPIEECIGNGSGVNQLQYQQKVATLKEVIQFHHTPYRKDAQTVLTRFGGFEIVQMCAGMLRAAEKKMIILVDGFISTAAFIAAHQIDPQIMDYTLFTHCSNEQGHTKMLNYLKSSSILNLEMRLGEGSGIAVTFPIIKSACHFLNEMASFESALVSKKTE